MFWSCFEQGIGQGDLQRSLPKEGPFNLDPSKLLEGSMILVYQMMLLKTVGGPLTLQL